MRQHGIRCFDTSYEGMEQRGSRVAYGGDGAGGGTRMLPMMPVSFHTHGPSIKFTTPRGVRGSNEEIADRDVTRSCEGNITISSEVRISTGWRFN